MKPYPARKYRPVATIPLPDRQWPSRTITRAPIWCSVDLRDGNQALIEPMDADRKLRMFRLLVKMGYKEIEIGFPAASQTDYDFTRKLIDGNLIPDDVTVQVLTQSREAQIARTFEALDGVERAIVHLYNSTSTTQRRLVFNLDREGIKNIAVSGAKLIRDAVARRPQTDWFLEYSPESFTGTELDFAVEICDAVTDVFNPNVVRSSTGVLFSVPLVVADSRAVHAWLRAKSVRIVATTPDTPHVYTQTELRGPLAIVMGSEQYGLSEFWLKESDRLVRIPMAGQADSLNVAMATIITLFEAVRQRTA